MCSCEGSDKRGLRLNTYNRHGKKKTMRVIEKEIEVANHGF